MAYTTNENSQHLKMTLATKKTSYLKEASNPNSC